MEKTTAYALFFVWICIEIYTAFGCYDSGYDSGIKIGYSNGVKASYNKGLKVKTELPARAINTICDSCFNAGAAFGITTCTKILDAKTKGYHLVKNEQP